MRQFSVTAKNTCSRSLQVRAWGRLNTCGRLWGPLASGFMAVLIGLGSSTPAGQAATIYVAPTGANGNNGGSWAAAKQTVTAGLAAALSGDQVWVAQGTYVGTVTLKSGVSLYGGFAGNETALAERNWRTHVTILDSNAADWVVMTPTDQHTAGMRLDGFTIRNGKNYGVFCGGTEPLTVVNNYVTGTTANPLAGIGCTGGSPVVMNNVVAGNGGTGITCTGGTPLIADNTVFANLGYGIDYQNYSQARIFNNTVVANNRGGINISASPGASISNNLVCFNAAGIVTSGGSGIILSNNCVYNPVGANYTGHTPGTGDINADPGLVGAEFGQFHLTASSPCRDAGLDTAIQAGWLDMDGQPRKQGTHVDIGADEFDGSAPPYAPTIVRVSPAGNDLNDGSSWATAKLTVQAGIDLAASAGGEVWVAAGVYNQRIRLAKWVHVYGGFAGTEDARAQRDWRNRPTVLDGGAGGSVVTVPTGSVLCAIDGFTIRNGSGSQVGQYDSMRCGGGVLCIDSLARIANNLITRNVADAPGSPGNGGGIYSSGGAPLIVNNTITDNHTGLKASGGGGGGIWCSGSPTIANNTIVGNGAGGTELANNSGGGSGGGVYCQGAAIITNNTIVANSASIGGGFYSGTDLSKIPVLSGNIIAFNSCGVAKYSNSYLTLSNNCVYNPDGYDYSSATAGPGDFSADPRIENLACGRVHLLPGSPCIDAGLDSAVQPGWLDMDGTARVQGSHVDMGADEYDGTTPPPFTPPVIRVSQAGNDANDGQNWASAKKTIQAAIDAATLTGGEVWVAAGTYDQRIVLRPWVYLYGGFAGTEDSRDQRNPTLNPTVLSPTSAEYVVNAAAGHRVSRIDGFTLRGSTSTAIFALCSPLIFNNTITACGWSGVFAVGAPVVSGNTILGNPGVGISCSGAAIISGNNVRNNGLGGINVSGTSRILGNIVAGNVTFNNGDYAGGITVSGASVVANNFIVGNASRIGGYGGGVVCTGSSPVTIVNNTIVGNWATFGAGIACRTSVESLLANNIVAFGPSGIYRSGGTPSLRNNCVYNPSGTNYSGLSAGATDISVDPQLLDMETRELHLLAGSPCIGAGAADVLQTGWTDIDGESRVLGAQVDIGADEFNGVTPEPIRIIVRVSPSGNDAADGLSWASAKRTVQAGINAAAALGGGDVWVAAGTYPERLTLPSWVRLYGGFSGDETAREQRDRNAHVTRLDGQNAGTVVTTARNAAMCAVDGFVITNGLANNTNGSRTGGGVNCAYALSTISNNTIVSNCADNGGGICGGSAYLTIANNRIMGNYGGPTYPNTQGGGLFLSACMATVANNIIAGNAVNSDPVSPGLGGGIYSSGSIVTIVNNTIVSNALSATGGGVWFSPNTTTGVPASIFANNIVAFNASGIYGSGVGLTLRNNCVFNPNGANYTNLTAGTGDISVDPQLLALEFGDPHLVAGSPCIDAGLDTAVLPGDVDVDRQSRLQGTHVDIGADEFDGTTPTPTHALVRVSPAGDDANDGSTWQLAKRSVQAAASAVAATGGEVWVAAGVYTERLNLPSYTYVYGGFVGTEISREERNWIAHSTVLDAAGSGVALIVRAGDHVSGVDGVTLRGSHSTPGSGTSAYGGVYCYCASPTLKNLVVTQNENGGIVCRSGSPTIVGCTISENNGSGISCIMCPAPIIRNNTVTGNIASTGGGLYIHTSSPIIANNVIAANSSSIGAGIACSGGTVTITNNTLIANTADTGSIYCSGTSATLANNIVAFNSSGISKPASGTLSLANNCVYNPGGVDYSGLSPGTGDFSADPGLLAAGYGQIHLVAGSPCIDAGLDTAVSANALDIDGEPRIQYAHVDIGADEYNGTDPVFSPVIVLVSPAGDNAHDGLTWGTAKRTVQAGVDAAAAVGGEVWVAAGTYPEAIILKPWVYMYGGFAGTESRRAERNWQTHTTTLAGSNNMSAVVNTLTGHRSSGLDGFVIRNAMAFQCGVLCANSSPVIVHNRILGCYGGGAGVSCQGGSAVVAHNLIAGHTSSNAGGVYCTSSSSALILNNTIIRNSAFGIYCNSGSPTITNNLVAFNASGIYKSTGTPALNRNCVYNPDGVNYSGLTAGSTDIADDPRLVAVDYGKPYLSAASPCIDAGLDSVIPAGELDVDGEPRLLGAHVDIGADEFNGTTPAFQPAVVRVSTWGNDANDGVTWSSAKRTVQAGIDTASAAGGEVWVAEGTYFGPVNLQPWVYVYGGFTGTETARDQRSWVASPTILDGDAAGSVVTVAVGYRSNRLDGFVIRNGHAANYGGGIYCYVSAPVLANNRVIENGAPYGGGICSYSATPLLVNNVLANNTATVQGGGLFNSNASLTAVNCTFSGNTANSGAAIYNSNSSNVRLTNCVLWGNNGPAVTNNSSTPVITYCDVQGGYSGTGNINGDPRFIRNPGSGADGTWGTGDDDYGDFRLQAGSPCIDAGQNAAVLVGTITDLDAHGRFFNDPATADCTTAPGTCGTSPIVDMGAYEFIAGDYDRDSDIDAADLTLFQACVSGPAVPFAGDCLKADLNRDGDVDLADYGIFQRCYTGPGISPNPACAP